ncbi:MAG: DUF1841 family protein [Pseudomonadota bacterium]
MIFSQERHILRQLFIDAWAKYRAAEALEPLEKVIATVVREHPEYHASLENADTALDQDYLPELGQSNPFLHMSLHIAVREQLAADRPAGILEIYQSLLNKYHDPHNVEHRMIDCLGETLWRAQRAGAPPDEAAYMECLSKAACSS